MASRRETVGRKPIDDPDFVEAAQAFANARRRPALIYFLPDEAIGTSNVLEVRDRLGDRRFEELDFVIHSTGGDIHAAYQLVTFLRDRANRLIACVPLYARSAATLLGLGAHLIVLDELASLGPLDAQAFDREASSKEGTALYVSALTPFKTLERLRDLSLDTLEAAAEMLYDHHVQRTDDVLKYGMEFVSVTMGPLFEKQRSEKLGEFNQMLAVGEQYGQRLLRDTLRVSEEERRRIVRRLVHEYPSHEYIIDYRELLEIGFSVKLFEDAERSAARELARYAGKRLISLVEPASTPVEEAVGAKREVEVESVAPRTETIDTGPVPAGGGLESRHLRQESGSQAGLDRTNPWRRRPSS